MEFVVVIALVSIGVGVIGIFTRTLLILWLMVWHHLLCAL